MMTLRAWWARLRLPYINARMKRTWRAHEAAITARYGCRRYMPDDDFVDAPKPDVRGWDAEATQPLPWVDPKPLLTPAARARADEARRRAQR